MQSFQTGWNLSQVVRLLIGLAALVQGIIQKEGLVLAAGSWILVGAVFNFGCCGGSGCSIPKATHITKEEVVYEEVDVSK